MTVVAQPPIGVQPYVRPSLRYRLIRAAIVLTALAVVGGGIGALVYVNHYQPLGRAGASVTGTDDPRVMKRVSDGLRSETWILRGPAGTMGTVSYTIANNGHFDVTLLGPAPGQGLTYHWASPSLPLPDGSSRSSTLADAYRLPMTLHAHQTIELFVTVTKKNCTPDGSRIYEDLPLRWRALGVHHETDISLDPQDSSFPPIAVCYPRSVLKNIEH